MLFSFSLVSLLLASATNAAFCKAPKGKYAGVGSTIELQTVMASNAESKAAGFILSISGKLEILDDCTFQLVDLELSNPVVPVDAQLTWYGGSDLDITSYGFPIVNQPGMANNTPVYLNGSFPSKSKSPIFELSPLVDTKDTDIGASFNDFKQFRLYSLKYKFVLAYANLPELQSAPTKTVLEGSTKAAGETKATNTNSANGKYVVSAGLMMIGVLAFFL